MASACLLEDERIVLSRRVIDAVHPSVMLDDNLGMARRKTAIGDETLPSDGSAAALRNRSMHSDHRLK
jgi:hypothetical protein